MDNKKTQQTEQHGEEFIVRIQGQTSRMGTALKNMCGYFPLGL